jgi:cold shock CspA family protein
VDGPRRGTVVTFDPARGLGEVVDGDGHRFPFHCTAIADGSRTIPVGAAVVFLIGPGHQGRWEARSLQPVDPGAA